MNPGDSRDPGDPDPLAGIWSHTGNGLMPGHPHISLSLKRFTSILSVFYLAETLKPMNL